MIADTAASTPMNARGCVSDWIMVAPSGAPEQVRVAGSVCTSAALNT